MRILFFGMRCIFSPPVLAALIEAGHTICGIVVPGPSGGAPWHWDRPPGARLGPPMAGQPTLDSLAARHGIPIARAGSLRHPEIPEQLRGLRPDVIVVACFPRLLPPEMVAIAPRGGINLHPSLLPALRGPEPLFWTLRAGLRESGVTAHQLSGRFDAGAIYGQAPVSVPFGERMDVIERHFADIAGRLAVEVIDAIEQERATPRLQDETRASLAPVPTAQDFVIDPSWTAERAYAFARAVAPLRGPLAVTLLDGPVTPVIDAATWSPNAPDPAAAAATCDRIWVRFVTGYVCFITPEK
jgi:methionyl-tRNA formyltransferase